MADWINFGTGRKAATNFGKVANMSENGTLMFDGYTYSASGYALSTDGTKFKLPINDLETVCSVVNTRLTKRVKLKYSMPVKTDFSDFNYRHTFRNCTIGFEKSGNRVWFTKRATIDVASIFESATFMTHNDELVVDDSALRVNSMFYNSKGLYKLTFDTCNLTDLRRLMVDSDVRELEFDACRFILDNDQLVNYEGVSALTVFGSKIEKITLSNCSKDFVELVMKLFDDEWDLYPRLEIEILD